MDAKYYFFFLQAHSLFKKNIEEGETCSERPVGADWWPMCSEVWGLGPVNQVLPPERAKEWDHPATRLAPALPAAEPATSLPALVHSGWLEDSLSLGCHNPREVFGIKERDFSISSAKILNTAKALTLRSLLLGSPQRCLRVCGAAWSPRGAFGCK